MLPGPGTCLNAASGDTCQLPIAAMAVPVQLPAAVDRAARPIRLQSQVSCSLNSFAGVMWGTT